MNDYYFYFNDVVNCSGELVIIKAPDEKQAKQKLINTYFKVLFLWSTKII